MSTAKVKKLTSLELVRTILDDALVSGFHGRVNKYTLKEVHRYLFELFVRLGEPRTPQEIENLLKDIFDLPDDFKF